MAVDVKKVIDVGSSLPLCSNEKGIMAAFGIYAAFNYNEFFFQVVSRVRHIVSDTDALALEKKLYDAVVDCAYYTFHGARTSMDWREYIAPMIETPEDEVAALVAFINVFGVGYIELNELIPGKKLVTVVRNAYDPGRYLEEYGVQSVSSCYLFQACTAACMDLVYGARFPDGKGTFFCREPLCRAKGDEFCKFIAEPATGGND